MAQFIAVGTLFESDFVDGVSDFVKISNFIGENWEIVSTGPKGEHVYLKKKSVKTLSVHSDTTGINVISDSSDNSEDGGELSNFQLESEHFADSAELCGVHDDCNASVLESCTFEYHVIYSQSYGVPVLYLNAFKANGQLLSLEEMWLYIPDMHKDRLQHEKWTFLTQVEHPYLGLPFYYLHPCHTSELMSHVPLIPDNKEPQASAEQKRVGKDDSNEVVKVDDNVGSDLEVHQAKKTVESISLGYKYLVAWLSSVGPVVHLDIPIQFASQL